jgi:hypothetical protein
MVVYNAISDYGKAHFTNEEGQMILTLDQGKYYMVEVQADGSLASKFIKSRLTQPTANFFIYNPFRYPIHVEWKDPKSTGSKLFNTCTDPPEPHELWVPWIDPGFGSFFQMTIDLIPVLQPRPEEGRLYNIIDIGDVTLSGPEISQTVASGDITCVIAGDGSITLESSGGGRPILVQIVTPCQVPYEMYSFIPESSQGCLFAVSPPGPFLPLNISDLQIITFPPIFESCSETSNQCREGCQGNCPEGQICQKTECGIYSCVDKPPPPPKPEPESESSFKFPWWGILLIVLAILLVIILIAFGISRSVKKSHPPPVVSPTSKSL